MLFGFNGRATRNFIALLVLMHFILFVDRVNLAAAAPVILISTHAEPDLTDMIETSPATGFVAKSALSATAITAALARGGESK